MQQLIFFSYILVYGFLVLFFYFFVLLLDFILEVHRMMGWLDWSKLQKTKFDTRTKLDSGG